MQKRILVCKKLLAVYPSNLPQALVNIANFDILLPLWKHFTKIEPYTKALIISGNTVGLNDETAALKKG